MFCKSFQLRFRSPEGFSFQGHISFKPTLDQQRTCANCSQSLLDGDFTVKYDVKRTTPDNLQVNLTADSFALLNGLSLHGKCQGEVKASYSLKGRELIVTTQLQHPRAQFPQNLSKADPEKEFKFRQESRSSGISVVMRQSEVKVESQSGWDTDQWGPWTDRGETGQGY